MLFQIDLKRQPQVADLIAGMDMGTPVKFITTLKSNKNDLAEFTLEKAEELSPEEMKARETENDADEGGEQMDEAQAEKEGTQRPHSRMPFTGGSQNTPGGSQDQDRLAAATSAQI